MRWWVVASPCEDARTARWRAKCVPRAPRSSTSSCWSVFSSSAWRAPTDRKSTRLNSSHLGSSYAVFCLKKKTKAARPERGHLHETGCGHAAVGRVVVCARQHFVVHMVVADGRAADGGYCHDGRLPRPDPVLQCVQLQIGPSFVFSPRVQEPLVEHGRRLGAAGPLRDRVCAVFFFFNEPAPPEIYTLSLHDALPI